MKTAAEKIREARKSKEMSQMAVANQVGVSLLTYILWEKGGTKLPHAGNLKRLEEVLEINLREE